MLARLKQLAASGELRLETTLATRSYLPWLSSLRARGYAVDWFLLCYRAGDRLRRELRSACVWVARSAEAVSVGAIAVASRTSSGSTGRAADGFFDNSRPAGPRLIACGGRGGRHRGPAVWTTWMEQLSDRPR